MVNDPTLNPYCNHTLISPLSIPDLSNGIFCDNFDKYRSSALIQARGLEFNMAAAVWSILPHEVRSQYKESILLAYHELKTLSELGLLGCRVMLIVHRQLQGFTVHQQKVFDQRPVLRIVNTCIINHINVDKWRRLGISLEIPKEALTHISSTHLSCAERYLDVLIYWLDHNEAASWRTLLEELSNFETKHTMDQLMQKVLAIQGSEVSCASSLHVPLYTMQSSSVIIVWHARPPVEGSGGIA